MKILCNIEGADGKGLSSLAGAEFREETEARSLLGRRDNILYICISKGKEILVTSLILNGKQAKIPQVNSSGGCLNYQGGCGNYQGGCGNYQGGCGNYQGGYY